MANTIITKNSSTASAVPTSGDLVQGELAVNVTDKRLFTKNSGGTVVELGVNPSSVTTGNATVGGTLGVTGLATLASSTLTANLTLSSGTANGVTYLNGSKVLTSGSALTFDGANFGGGVNVLVSDNKAIGFGSNAYWLGNSASGFVAGYINGSEQMRLTSTGLGIGTSSPAYKLDVTGTAAISGGVILGASTNLTWGGVYGANIPTIAGSSNTLQFYPAGSTSGEQMRLDSSGNLGLGVTPIGWDGTVGGAYVFGSTGKGSLSYSGSAVSLGDNFYRSSSGFRYTTTAAVSLYQMALGKHIWYTAPSGTAGSAISFTQAMTLDASGNLLVGTTSANFSAAGRGNINVNGSSDALITLSKGGSSTTAAYFYFDGTDAEIRNINNGALKLATNNTERARIDSSGRLLVGQTAIVLNNNNRAEFTGACGIGVVSNGGAAFSGIQSWNQASSGDNVFAEFLSDAGGSLRGSITYNRGAGLTSYNTTSDYRAKDIYGGITDSGSVIDSTPVYMGKMKGATQERPMFIAHETPAYAHTGEKDAVDADGNPVYQQMDASALIPVMWAEIQSLRQRLAAAGI